MKVMVKSKEVTLRRKLIMSKPETPPLTAIIIITTWLVYIEIRKPPPNRDTLAESKTDTVEIKRKILVGLSRITPFVSNKALLEG